MRGKERERGRGRERERERVTSELEQDLFKSSKHCQYLNKKKSNVQYFYLYVFLRLTENESTVV